MQLLFIRFYHQNVYLFQVKNVSRFLATTIQMFNIAVYTNNNLNLNAITSCFRFNFEMINCCYRVRYLQKVCFATISETVYIIPRILHYSLA